MIFENIRKERCSRKILECWPEFRTCFTPVINLNEKQQKIIILNRIKMKDWHFRNIKTMHILYKKTYQKERDCKKNL